VDFVRSPAGQKYATGFAESAGTSQNAILNSVRVGIVLLFGGMGFAFTSFANEGLVALRIGAALSCLGVGFLVSAAISYWLAKKFARETKE
jgi:membrane protein implicated in regulation of membrane protease activity